MKEIQDDMFILEMRILWQNTPHRTKLGSIIREYFGEERAEPIINKLQETLSTVIIEPN